MATGCITTPHALPPLSAEAQQRRGRELTMLIKNPRPDIRRQGYETAGPNPYEAGSIEAVNFEAGQRDFYQENS